MNYKVSIIGSGTMGLSIAQLLASTETVNHIQIITRKDKIEASQSTIESFLNKQIKKKKLPPILIDSFHDRFTFSYDYTLLRNSNLIIEAITENIEKKKSLLAEISEYTNDDSIIASNTSSLSITELSTAYKIPSKVIGIHFFNPATIMELNEIIVGFTTDKETLNEALEFSRKLGKESVLVNESPGFIVNRMLIPMINEAITILAEGVASAEDIDKAMKLGAHHPMGPLALADFIGNDVNLSIMETLFKETGDPKYRPHALLRKMVRANFLGRKTKQGFFKY
ncbi:3-hydroxyacyl-CoA dehydrogenase family protein [Thiothrix lacustris]|uniref:3-hydroxyacyl-CoA dehydrogenase family protein n=1 Tax=Thiothrix lacustris TaxID=525917 RepID=UPI00048E7D35|nr:3-hydroxyacyl-CoA dehydrogenase NAD-binding domain-containing protein [Thiothrix lacustris]